MFCDLRFGSNEKLNKNVCIPGDGDVQKLGVRREEGGLWGQG